MEMPKMLKLSLDRLKELYNEGIYTESQFIDKRERLLSGAIEYYKGGC